MDCHSGNQSNRYNLSPDLVPSSYDMAAANDNTDGYPDHDTWDPRDGTVSPAQPHLKSMLWDNVLTSRTVSGSEVAEPYGPTSPLRSPSSDPLNDYAFCLSCHVRLLPLLPRRERQYLAPGHNGCQHPERLRQRQGALLQVASPHGRRLERPDSLPGLPCGALQR
jgi:hypothetical protein